MQVTITASFMVILQAVTVVQAAGLSTAVAISEVQGLSTADPESTPSVSGPPVLSRLVRSAEVARGVQYPIPPVPEQSSLQGPHP